MAGIQRAINQLLGGFTETTRSRGFQKLVNPKIENKELEQPEITTDVAGVQSYLLNMSPLDRNQQMGNIALQKAQNNINNIVKQKKMVKRRFRKWVK